MDFPKVFFPTTDIYKLMPFASNKRAVFKQMLTLFQSHEIGRPFSINRFMPKEISKPNAETLQERLREKAKEKASIQRKKRRKQKTAEEAPQTERSKKRQEKQRREAVQKARKEQYIEQMLNTEIPRIPKGRDRNKPLNTPAMLWTQEECEILRLLGHSQRGLSETEWQKLYATFIGTYADLVLMQCAHCGRSLDNALDFHRINDRLLYCISCFWKKAPHIKENVFAQYVEKVRHQVFNTIEGFQSTHFGGGTISIPSLMDLTQLEKSANQHTKCEN